MVTEKVIWVYVLESETNGRRYHGQTNDLPERVQLHNAGRVLSTRVGRPWKLLGAIPCRTRRDAMQLELKLKRAKNRTYVLWMLEQQGESSCG